MLNSTSELVSLLDGLLPHDSRNIQVCVSFDTNRSGEVIEDAMAATHGTPGLRATVHPGQNSDGSRHVEVSVVQRVP